MAQANDVTSLNGLFKQVYADKLENLIPDGKVVINTIPFVSRDRQPGNFYNQPVILGMEHGVTFGNEEDGAFTLEPAIAGSVKNAAVRGYQLVLRSVLSYSAAARAAGGEPKAFEDATKYLVGNMLDSVTKKLEIELMYGQTSYGVVASISGSTITIKDAEFASGIWAGAENMPIEFFAPAGDGISPTGAALASTTVVSVDLDAKTVTLASGTNVAANQVILHKSAKDKEFAGIHKILANTGSMFGIDAATYNMWKGSEFTASPTSVLTFAILQQAISKGVAKGLDQDVTVLVSPTHWDDLLTEQAALRMYDSSHKSDKAENGAKSIAFFSQNGMVEVKPSIFVKEGYSYVLCKEDWVRVGSTDVTFKRPGQGENFFRDLESQAGYELRCYTDQALMCVKPGRSILIKGLKAE
jgi:hypothetical protein